MFYIIRILLSSRIGSFYDSLLCTNTTYSIASSLNRWPQGICLGFKISIK